MRKPLLILFTVLLLSIPTVLMANSIYYVGTWVNFEKRMSVTFTETTMNNNPFTIKDRLKDDTIVGTVIVMNKDNTMFAIMHNEKDPNTITLFNNRMDPITFQKIKDN